MCDTMVALPCSTEDGSLLFAKNSDREPNEPHIIVRIPGRSVKRGDKIDCTYISVEYDGRGGELANDTILFKPRWIWGAEMGVNDKGLVIGNEAVFTKEKTEDIGLLGMDILRLALEFCGSAGEALDYITSLIEKYGQGGKAGYTQNLKYHNSYIIADFKEAYVLESAGRYWVYRKVRDVYSISNALSIRDEYDGCSRGVVEHALEKGWCKRKEEFDFKKCYESRLHLYFTKGDIRRNTSMEYLKNRMNSLKAADMKLLLRSHGGNAEVENFRTGSMSCICMHAGGGPITSQTTGSFIVRLKEGRIDIWATGSSIPCLSVFKPIWFVKSGGGIINEETAGHPEEFWRLAEDRHRAVLTGRAMGVEDYLQGRDRLEEELMELAERAFTDEERAELMNYAVTCEKALLDKLELRAEDSPAEKRGRIFYRMYWKGQNRKLEGGR